MLKKLIEAWRHHRLFERTLVLHTPVIYGKESRRLSRALRFDNTRADELLQAVPFEPRETYPARALDWANGR